MTLTCSSPIHKQCIDAGFVRSNTQPQQMTVDAFEPRNNLPDCLGPHRDFHLRQLFHAHGIGHRVDVRADTAYALEEIQVLDPVAAFSRLLDAAMGISKTHPRRRHDLPVDCELEVARLLQRRMLRSNGNDKGVASDNAFVRQLVRVTARDRRGLFDGEIPAEGVHILRPVIREEQSLAGPGTCDLEAKHFMQFALEESRWRDDIFDRRDGCITAARLADTQGHDRGAITKVVERLDLTVLCAQIHTSDGREVAPMGVMQRRHGRAQVIHRDDDVHPVRFGTGRLHIPVCKKLLGFL